MQLRRPLASTLGLKLVINHSQPFRIVFLQCQPIPWALSLITTPPPSLKLWRDCPAPQCAPLHPTWKRVRTFTAVLAGGQCCRSCGPHCPPAVGDPAPSPGSGAASERIAPVADSGWVPGVTGSDMVFVQEGLRVLFSLYEVREAEQGREKEGLNRWCTFSFLSAPRFFPLFIFWSRHLGS